MTMLLLKRFGTQLDRDVTLLAEAGEEGSTKIGIEVCRGTRGVVVG